MKRAKITIIGAGNVGATVAFRVAEGGLGDVVLVDAAPGVPQGKARDLRQAAPIVRRDGALVGTNEYGATEGSDIVVVTAGLARTPGMSRDDVRDANAEVVAEGVSRAVRKSRDSIIIMVTEPVEVMCEVARRVSGFPRARVIGMAGIVDAARMRALVAQELGVSSECVSALALGGHGDAMMALPRYTTVSGVPLPELLAPDRIDAIVRRAAAGSGEAGALPGTGPAHYAPAAGAFEMADAIVGDRKKILPCAVRLEGEFGVRDAFVGVPAKLGASGMEGVFEVELTAEETARLHGFAGEVRAQCAQLATEAVAK